MLHIVLNPNNDLQKNEDLKPGNWKTKNIHMKHAKMEMIKKASDKF